MANTAYIDGQNLHLATTKHPTGPWRIDLTRFRVYLREKYDVGEAYYYLGYPNGIYNDLYEALQRAGFIVRFRDHQPTLLSEKKGNVDTEIILDVMIHLYREVPGNILLVSGDGDYARLTRFLIGEERFVKILFPHRAKASSLYRTIGNEYCIDLNEEDVRRKIGRGGNKKGAT